MRLPKVVYMLPDELEDYVHNEAIVGDILKSFSNECGVLREYVYCCNKDNIGKDVKPGWMMLGYNNSFVGKSERTMKAEDLIVSAEDVKTGKRLIGYVCGCKGCRTAFEDEEYDRSRPIGLLTHPEELYGNVRVYTDNMESIKFYK